MPGWGQDYVSIVADLDARRVVFATAGRSADTVARFAADLAGHGGDPEKVTLTIRLELKHTRWLWPKNYANLSVAQRRELHRLMRPSAQLATARALRWPEDFHAFATSTPATHPSTCDAGATARNAPACNRSRSSSPWSRTLLILHEGSLLYR